MGIEVNLENRTVTNTGTEALSLIELIMKVTPILPGETVTLDKDTEVIKF